MKKLSEFDEVKKALSQVEAASDVDNGTHGIEFLAYSYSHDTVYDKKKELLQTALSKAVLKGNLQEAEVAMKALENPEPSKIITIWKLIEPLKRIQGTKIISSGEKRFSISMENVSLIHIPQDSIMLGIVEGEETGEIAQNIQGKDVKVMRLKIVKGLIDVAAPVLDRFDREILPKRAFVTPISYRAMQVAGGLMASDRLAEKRRYGFDEIV